MSRRQLIDVLMTLNGGGGADTKGTARRLELSVEELMDEYGGDVKSDFITKELWYGGGE